MRHIKKKRKNKKAVMDLPFGFIFAMILIIAFIVVAFYVVRHFLCTGDITQSGMFIQDLQGDIDEAWKAPDINITKEYGLPGKADYVCFVDFSSSKKGSNQDMYESLVMYEDLWNMFLFPKDNCLIWSKEIKHIDIAGITETKNPYCIKTKNGIVEIKLEKGFYDSLVRIS